MANQRNLVPAFVLRQQSVHVVQSVSMVFARIPHPFFTCAEILSNKQMTRDQFTTINLKYYYYQIEENDARRSKSFRSAASGEKWLWLEAYGRQWCDVDVGVLIQLSVIVLCDGKQFSKFMRTIFGYSHSHSYTYAICQSQCGWVSAHRIKRRESTQHIQLIH